MRERVWATKVVVQVGDDLQVEVGEGPVRPAARSPAPDAGRARWDVAAATVLGLLRTAGAVELYSGARRERRSTEGRRMLMSLALEA